MKLTGYSDVPLNTSNEEIDRKVEIVRKGYRSDKTLSIDYRLDQLRNLYFAVQENAEMLKEAFYKDMHRSPYETESLELHGIYAEIDLAINKLPEWAADEKVSGGTKFMTANPKLTKIPFGNVLIISPWNYPFFLAFVPIANAIAAGNTVVFKPTEVIPNSTQAVTKILESALDPEVCQVVNGAVPETSYLLEKQFDKIMVTGSCRLGKIVAQAAAKYTTPCILELGGKSPVFVGKSANLKVSADRIVWGKLVNAGQTCVAPDYVLIDKAVKDEFLKHVKNAIDRFYPQLNADSPDYAHIPNERLFDRLDGLLADTKGKIIVGGERDKSRLYISPTIVDNVKADDPLMEDELFSPILPIVPVDDIVEEGIDFVRTYHDTPLALYVFSNNKKEADSIIRRTRSGGAIINDVLLHVGTNNLPFGGIGKSGHGAYHGKAGFDAFSHQRALLNQPFWADMIMKLRYPPYTPAKANMMANTSVPKPWYKRTGSVRRCWITRLIKNKWLWAIVIAAVTQRFVNVNISLK
jgi:aldehyde dehydrogenase (NAD+)